MTDISFFCDKCGQHILIEDSAAGTKVDCPGCAAQLEVPHQSVSLNAGAAHSPQPNPSRKSQRRAIAACALVAVAIAVISLICAGVRQYERVLAADAVANEKAAAARLAQEGAQRRQTEAAEETQRKQEETAQEAKQIEDRDRAAKAQFDAEFKNVEAQVQQEAAQQARQDRSEMEAAIRQIVAVTRQAERARPRPVRPLIEAAIQELEAAVREAEEVPQAKTEPLVEAATRRFEATVEQAMQRVRIVDWSWSKDEVGMTMNASFVIENTSASDIKDIEITCHHFAPSGTEIDSNTRTVYEIIPAGRRLTVKNFNMGFIHSQVQNSAATITDFAVIK